MTGVFPDASSFFGVVSFAIRCFPDYVHIIRIVCWIGWAFSNHLVQLTFEEKENVWDKFFLQHHPVVSHRYPNLEP